LLSWILFVIHNEFLRWGKQRMQSVLRCSNQHSTHSLRYAIINEKEWRFWWHFQVIYVSVRSARSCSLRTSTLHNAPSVSKKYNLLSRHTQHNKWTFCTKRIKMRNLIVVDQGSRHSTSNLNESSTSIPLLEGSQETRCKVMGFADNFLAETRTKGLFRWNFVARKEKTGAHYVCFTSALSSNQRLSYSHPLSVL
jgi:hypothetical protein